jgi:N-6 DNA Methylase
MSSAFIPVVICGASNAEFKKPICGAGTVKKWSCWRRPSLKLSFEIEADEQQANDESGGDDAYAHFPQHYRSQVPEECHWHGVRAVTTDVRQTLQTALRGIEKANPETLYGIFGDAQWTNKDRLSDTVLRDPVEHFSTPELTVANPPEDNLGESYEYLTKKVADDSGHTATEFYTNRTVVHLKAEMLEPQPGESIYNLTCGSGGMLLSAVAHLRRQGQAWHNVRLYGQERNLMTSAIARMNCFLQGGEDFRTERIVADIDDVVKKVCFPDWQHTSQGERPVQREVRRTLLKKNSHGSGSSTRPIAISGSITEVGPRRSPGPTIHRWNL